VPEPIRLPYISSARILLESLEAFGLDGLARQHSRKPEEAYDLVDALLPSHARKADIFSRQVRPGWDSWGDEVDKFEALPWSYRCGRGVQDTHRIVAEPQLQSNPGKKTTNG
jgi:hypothetical protein